MRSFTGLLSEIVHTLAAYVSGQLRIIAIMAVLYAVGFAICGVPAWPLIAIVCALLYVVPHFGGLIAMALAIGLTWISGADIWRIFGVLAALVVVQGLEGWVLTPRILGRRLGLRPLVVFFAIIAGGAIFGPIGVLLAVPVIAVANVLLKFLRPPATPADTPKDRGISG